MYLLKINTAGRGMLSGTTPVKGYYRGNVFHTIEVQPLDALPLSPVELLALDICISLYNAGYREFDALDVLGACNGVERVKPSKVSTEQINEINTVIIHLRDISIYIDNSTAPLLDVVANGCKVYHYRDGVGTATNWKFVGPPLLLDNANDLRGVITYPVELMKLGCTRGTQSACIKKYLLDRIFTSNAQKGKRYKKRTGANIVRLSTIKKVAGCTTRQATQKTRQRVHNLLDVFATCDAVPLLSYDIIDAGTPRERYKLVFGNRD